MNRAVCRAIFALVLWPVFGLFGGGAQADQMASSHGDLTVTQMADGLDAPWALGFLPGGGFLITERDGQLLYFDGAGARQEVKGVPRVFAKGQGGLLDVVVSRGFADDRVLYFTYAKRMSGGGGTAVATARLSADHSRLEGWRDIFVMDRGARGGRHFGSRLVEATNGDLFITIGDRGDDDLAQDPARHNGTVIRIRADGAVPSDNPGDTLGAGALPEIWSIGHRNPQGAAIAPDGQLWVVEHGPRGGDEINQVKKGANYGWPVIGYGTHYSGAKVGVGTHAEGLEQPALYWDPSIAPSGMMIYDGAMFADWRGQMFIGSLKFDYISRVGPQGGGLVELEQLRSDLTGRVRDVRQAPDGAIWYVSVGQGAVYRLSR